MSIMSRSIFRLSPRITKYSILIRNNNICQNIIIRSQSGKTDFGFQQVDTDQKEHMVKEVFTKVAQKYDVMNDLMSVGIHRFWKDDYVNMMGVRNMKDVCTSYESIPRHLDVAGGTGDIAFRSVEAYISTFSNSLNQFVFSHDERKPSERPIVVCDINKDMLAVGQDKARKLYGDDKSKMIGFVEGNAECLPFADNSFDFFTIAFGLRNVTNKDNALKDAYRVLKPGGKLQILEFSHLDNPILQKLYDEYSFRVIPPLGKLVADDAESYKYLVESIRKFPKQEELCHMMRAAKFSYVTYTNFTLGIVAVHSGFKIQ